MSQEFGFSIAPEHHELLYVGVCNRAGNIIDYKMHPVYIPSGHSLDEYKERIFREHTDISQLPMTYPRAKPFIILRPTGIQFADRVREDLIAMGRNIVAELHITNFIRLSDILYELDEGKHFTWKWRALTRSLHDSGVQDQSRAIVYVFDEEFSTSEDYEQAVVNARLNIRNEIGSTPYIFVHDNVPQFGMDLHHLHAADYDTIQLEFNAIMHAYNGTSVFEC